MAGFIKRVRDYMKTSKMARFVLSFVITTFGNNHILQAGMDIDMCIRIKHRQCTTVIWKYTRFFCGNEKFCEDHDEASKKKATEYSKQR